MQEPPRVVALIGQHREGISAVEIAAVFAGQDVHTCLSDLARTGRVVRPRRAFYITAGEVKLSRIGKIAR